MPQVPNFQDSPRYSGFTEILVRLDGSSAPGEESIGPEERYEALRRRLVRYFTWERCQDPEYCADETFSRVAAKISEGQEIANFRAYVFGVARVVRLEAATRLQREAAAIEALGRVQETTANPDAETSESDASERCFQHCLTQLSVEQRTFILRYYGGDGGGRIENRKQMAEEEGVALNALRNRALRLRDRLERCCRKCLQKAKPDGDGEDS